MNKSEQKQLQKKQLEILDEIDRICKKHKIKYYLDAGSLLGAIRHNGFIPWDDDMDIGMTRENYNKFMKIAPKEIRKDLFIQTLDSEENYPHAFSKIRMNHTLLLEKINVGKDIHQGIFVDIFPIDYAGNSLAMAKLKMIHCVSLRTMLLHRLGYPVKGRSTIQNIMISIMCTFSKFLTIKFLKKRIQKSLCSIKHKTKYMASFAGNSLFDAIYDTKVLEKYTTHKFEDRKYSILVEYDQYLKYLYHNYMELPPEETRYIGHGVLDIKIKTKSKRGI